MKTAILKSLTMVIFAILCLSAQNAAANVTEPDSKDEVYTVVDVQPQYSGGIPAMLSFINENVVYPEECVRQGIEGRVICRFTIDAEGNVSDPEVISGVHKAIDAEAVRVVGLLRFTPGYKDNKPVVCKFVVPISFKLK